MSIASALLAIQREVISPIGEDGKLTQPYRHTYTTKEALQEFIRPICNQHGVVVSASVTRQWDEGVAHSKQGELLMVRVEVEVRFIEAETGEFHAVLGQGSAADQYDKAVYKAQTSALRYALMQSLLISTGGALDADADGGPSDAELGSAKVDALHKREQAARERIATAAKRAGWDVAKILANADANKTANGPAAYPGFVEWLETSAAELEAQAPDQTPPAAVSGDPAPSPASSPSPEPGAAQTPAEAPQTGGDGLGTRMVSPDGGEIRVPADSVAAMVAAGFRFVDPSAPPAQSGGSPEVGWTDENEAKLDAMAQELAELRPDRGDKTEWLLSLTNRCKEWNGREPDNLSAQEAVAFLERIEKQVLVLREQKAGA